MKVPRQFSTMQHIVRSIWTSYDYLSSPYEYYPFIVVGGISNFSLYNFPDTAKQYMKWTMRPVHSVENRLKKIPYPDPNNPTSGEPLPITWFLPDYVFTTAEDEPRIGVWDEVENQWDFEPIDELEYHKNERRLEFSTRKLAPMAYLQ